jgi:hypothetical protein
LSTEDDKIYLKENPLVISIGDNKFIWKEFIEAPNNFTSYVSTNQIINVSFSSTPNVYNYRLGFYDVVDKFWNEENSSYTPEFRKKQIVDAVAWIWSVNVTKEEDLYKEIKDIVYISNVWDLRWVEVTTDWLKNIRDDLENWNVVSLWNGTSVYAADSTTTLKYVDSSSEEEKIIIIPKNRYIELNSTMNVVWIIWDGYVKTGEKITYSWTDIRSLIFKPLFVGTKISYVWNEFETREDTYIDLRYYDGTESSLNFNYVDSWELYDLWMISWTKYSITIPRKNDFYYAKLNSFQDNIVSTISNQILLSPQIQADNYAPLLGVNSIRVPVYQKKELDLTNYIYEDAWISAISKVYIDFDLWIDSDSDWNPKNDDDSSNMDNLNIIKTEEKVSIEVWVFEELINKKIGVIIIDLNGNIWNKEIQFEIYSPTPNINTYNENKFFWILDEDLTDEPVNIYRLRWWVVTKLENTEWTPFALTKEWDYDFAVLQEEPWLEITRDWTLIARVNEKTWKINTLASWYSIDALASNNVNNSDVFPKIILKNLSEEIFYETIRVSSSNPVQIVENFDNILNSWIYIQFLNLSNYSYLSIPENVSYNPWSLAIFRSGVNTNEELFIIFSDGRINALNEKYTLKYDTYWDYIMLKLIDNHFNREIANVLYKVSSEYVIQ